MTRTWIAAAAGLAGMICAAWLFWRPASDGGKGAGDSAKAQQEVQFKPIEWQLLQKLDYKTGEGPPEIKSLDNTHVRIPGFVVPLSDSFTEITEFLLVPDPQSCVHVPPPPPNLIVHVKLERALTSEQLFNPSWVSGILKIQRTESAFGYASYRLHASAVEKYVY